MKYETRFIFCTSGSPSSSSPALLPPARLAPATTSRTTSTEQAIMATASPKPRRTRRPLTTLRRMPPACSSGACRSVHAPRPPRTSAHADPLRARVCRRSAVPGRQRGLTCLRFSGRQLPRQDRIRCHPRSSNTRSRCAPQPPAWGQPPAAPNAPNPTGQQGQPPAAHNPSFVPTPRSY